jgi:DNA-directed RNA polymerase specialized sigma subunit
MAHTISPDNLYIGIKSEKDILGVLKRVKRNIYLQLYDVLHDIKDHDIKIQRLDKLLENAKSIKDIIDELLNSLPETKDIEELYKEINSEDLDKIEIKEKKKVRKKPKIEVIKEENKEDNNQIRKELDDISAELEELKEELKKLIES